MHQRQIGPPPLLVQPPELQQRTRFVKASATELPFESGTFSHVWSQACIYHVHDKAKCLREIHRKAQQPPPGFHPIEYW